MKSVKRSINRPHMQVTEAQTLDEALDILKSRQIFRKRTKPKITLKSELATNQLRQMNRTITLSDRTVPSKIKRRPKRSLDRPAWSKNQVVEQYKTGMFKITDLAIRAKVNVFVIKRWVWGDSWVPYKWDCCAGTVIKKTHCPVCGKSWQERYGAY